MTRKTSSARREAFFRALAETGNRTIAAERAKVSQSWVTLHRANDPEFRGRIEAAVAEARAELAGAAGTAPASGWGSLDGEELVVRGTNGRRTQIARARMKQWTPRVEARFLSVLAATCNVKAACAEVGLTAASAYGHAKRWQGFRERWREAVEIGFMRIEGAMLAHLSDSPFSGSGLDADAPMPPMTVDQAMHLLHMHKHEVRGIGGRPGTPRARATLESVRPGIERKVQLIVRGCEARERLDPAVLAEDEREWARRRGEE